MLKYLDLKKENGLSELPRILGLSASIVAQKCTKEQFKTLKKKLEAAMDSTVITTDDLANVLRWAKRSCSRLDMFIELGRSKLKKLTE